MARFKVNNASIRGISASIPSLSEFNREISDLSEKEKDLLIDTIGINERRLANSHTSAKDLGKAAAIELIDSLNWDYSSIEALIFVSQTPDYLIPGTSTQLQNELGLPKECLAFDINQGCAGYVYGLSVVSSLISHGGIKRALLIVADTITKILDQTDRSTRPIFSDAGSATAIEFDKLAAPMYFNLQTDGSKFQAIITDNFGFKNTSKSKTTEFPVMRMNGHEIFTFGLREVAKNINSTIEFANWEKAEIEAYVLHQANKLLNESIRKKVKESKEKFPETLSKYGNTSCATIPVTMVSECDLDSKPHKIKLILSGFGVGLSWGSAAVEIDQIKCPTIINYIERN